MSVERGWGSEEAWGGGVDRWAVMTVRRPPRPPPGANADEAEAAEWLIEDAWSMPQAQVSLSISMGAFREAQLERAACEASRPAEAG